MRRMWLCAAAVAAAGAAVANETAPEAVVFDEYGAISAPLSDVAGDAERGMAVYSERGQGNCVACHSISAMIEKVQFHGNVGPSLDGAGDRWTEAELRGIVANAKNVFDGTMMPSFYKTSGYIRPGEAFTMKPATEPLPPLLTAQQIEDVVAYLMTLKE